jgi:hypothetical protein
MDHATYILEPCKKRVRNIGKFNTIRRIILNQSRDKKRHFRTKILEWTVRWETSRKLLGEKTSNPASIRQPDASKDPEWMGLNDLDLNRIPMTTAYRGPTLIANQVKPLMSMDPGNLVEVARVVVGTTAKLKEQNIDYMSLLKKQ